MPFGLVQKSQDGRKPFDRAWCLHQAYRRLIRSRGVPLKTIEESRQWMADVLPSGSHPFTYAVLLRNTSEIGKCSAQMIGIVGVMHDPPELGYVFNPDYWGRGYASEALPVFLQLYRDKGTGEELKAVVHQGNNASEALLLKNGYVEKSRSQDERGNKVINFEVQRPM